MGELRHILFRKIMKERIEEAKKEVIFAYYGRDNKKECRWTTISYDDGTGLFEIHILEGTPLKGFVIANYGFGVVTAYKSDQREILRYEVSSSEASELIKKARSIIEGY